MYKRQGLCGAGVAFKLCAALDGCPPEEMLDYCGDLAAVGTVAEMCIRDRHRSIRAFAQCPQVTELVLVAGKNRDFVAQQAADCPKPCLLYTSRCV